MKIKFDHKLKSAKNFILIVLFYINVSFSIILCNKSDNGQSNIIHYNIPDPECTGPFGLCTQEDKDKLGYLAIKKLHEKMDDDRDGHIEIQETKEFMTEELQYKNDVNEREQKFHGSDSLISVDEMWKSWQHSQVYNWTTEEVIIWLNEQVKLPQYSDYFRRNRIDGQFLPRLAINENHYYSNVMQIKDSRHKRLLMIKSTDIVLFGQQQKPHNLIKDVLLVSALTLSIFFSIFLYTKHRQSLDRIKLMLNEVEKLSTTDEFVGTSLLNKIKYNLNQNETLNSNSQSTLSLFSLRKRSIFANSHSNSLNGVSNSFSNENQDSEFHKQLKENKIITEKNYKLVKELNIAKQEADFLRKAREGADGQIKRLELAEQELEKVRAALKQTETRLEMVKYQPPQTLISLLNHTYESERKLLEYKFSVIEKEKEACLDALNKISKRQSGILGALKIAHSSTLEEINHKLEILKCEINKCKAEKHEWTKRWNNIDELCNKSENILTENSSQEQQLFITLDNGLILPRKIWHNHIINYNNTSYDLSLSNQTSNFKTNSTNKLNEVQDETIRSSMVSNSSTAFLSSNNYNSQVVLNSVSTIMNKKSAYQNKSISATYNYLDNEQENNNFFNSINQINLVGIRSALNDPVIESKVEFDLEHNQQTNTDDGNNNNSNTLNQNFNSEQYILPKTPPAKLSFTNPDTFLQLDTIKTTNNPTATTTTIINKPTTQKIARDSLIHKNDVFQFDDVESVHTHDSLFRRTPQSSFESENYKNNDNNQYGLRNNRKKLAENKLITHLITPLLRTVNASQSSSSGSMKKPSRTQLRPQSISSQNSATSPTKIKKSITSVVIENGQKHTADLKNSSNISLEKTNGLSKHLNSLKRLISPRNSTNNLSNNPVTQLDVPQANDLIKSNSVDLIPIPSDSDFNTNLLRPLSNLNDNMNSTSVDNIAKNGNVKKSKKIFSFRLSKSKKKATKKGD